MQERKGDNISVVMACYHGDEVAFLEQSVESILLQSLQPFEFIIVVDGPVPHILNNYLEKISSVNDNIILKKLDQNLGAAEARNIGMTMATGDYVAIMDSDDIASSERLRFQLDAIKREKVDAVWGLQEEFDTELSCPAGLKPCPEKHDDIVRALKYRCLLSDPTTFFKRECLGKVKGYPSFIKLGIDHVFFTELYLNGFKFYCVQEVVLKVRVSSAQRKRRGGWDKLQQDYKVRRWMLKNGVISYFEFLMCLSLCACFRLQPNVFRDFMYKKILRR